MKADEDLLKLTEEILGNIELQQIPLHNILLKCLRLARIANDVDALEWLNQEINGFERDTENKLTSKAFKSMDRSNRKYFKFDSKENKTKSSYIVESIGSLEKTITALEQRLKLNNENINVWERKGCTQNIAEYTNCLEKIKGALYNYVLNFNFDLKYSNITESIFEAKRLFVDKKLKDICPESVKKFVSIYNNLRSENNEDWANAVHSCRRIIKDLSDSVYPPASETIMKGKKEINVGEENYINRLILFIEDKSESDSFISVVGSHLKYIGERIDSIYEASNKGTHSEVTLDEAERYIIYTYILISDILTLT